MATSRRKMPTRGATRKRKNAPVEWSGCGKKIAIYESSDEESEQQPPSPEGVARENAILRAKSYTSLAQLFQQQWNAGVREIHVKKLDNLRSFGEYLGTESTITYVRKALTNLSLCIDKAYQLKYKSGLRDLQEIQRVTAKWHTLSRMRGFLRNWKGTWDEFQRNIVQNTSDSVVCGHLDKIWARVKNVWCARMLHSRFVGYRKRQCHQTRVKWIQVNQRHICASLQPLLTRRNFVKSMAYLDSQDPSWLCLHHRGLPLFDPKDFLRPARIQQHGIPVMLNCSNMTGLAGLWQLMITLKAPTIRQRIGLELFPPTVNILLRHKLGGTERIYTILYQTPGKALCNWKLAFGLTGQLRYQNNKYLPQELSDLVQEFYMDYKL